MRIMDWSSDVCSSDLHTRTILTTIAILAALAAGSCKKKKEKVYPQYPPPSWKTEVTGQFTYTMTAVVKLPPELESANQAGDALAAFIGDQRSEERREGKGCVRTGR